MLTQTLLPTLFFAVFTVVSGQTTSTNTQCVRSCFDTDPILSFCDGDETGADLDECTCASFTPGNGLISCIQQCPEEDQIIYAQNLPALCAQSLFPALDLSAPTESGSTTVESTTSTATVDPGETATADATSTEDLAPTTATTGSSETASETASGAAATETGSGSGAAAIGVGAGVLGYVAYVAGMAAIL